jgi:hypothetical protein
MAEKLENYEFTKVGGRLAKYPWGRWLDGSTWRITRGGDFDVEVSSIRSAVTEAARRRGLRAESRIEHDSLIFRATPKEDA